MSDNQHKPLLKPLQSQQTEKPCSCGQPIVHARVGLCSICYKNKRKSDWNKNELSRHEKDSSRREKVLAYQNNIYHTKYRQNRLVKKICTCGNIALKNSRFCLCTECSKQCRLKRKVQYQLKRKSTHIPTKIRERIKDRLRTALESKDMYKSEILRSYLGCNMSQYLKYIEGLFYLRSNSEVMSRNNYGKEWHIDHTVPLYTATSNERLVELFKYYNTQPLWKEDHARKTKQENGSKMSS